MHLALGLKKPSYYFCRTCLPTAIVAMTECLSTTKLLFVILATATGVLTPGVITKHHAVADMVLVKTYC